MKKFLNKIIIYLVIFAIIITNFQPSYALVDVSKITPTTSSDKLTTTTIGIGGGGMLHSPSMSPFDSNTFIAVADMGGIYVTHDAGVSYDRKNLQGTAMFSYFDPTQKGVVYAGGSGLYRSTDNGDNFELIFPRKDDIVKKINMNENGLHYYYTKSKIYPTNKLIKDCIVNPNDSKNIFVISYYEKKGIVFESKDNGETFEKLFEYTKKTSGNVNYDYNKLFYKKETNELFMINFDGVFKFNRQTNSLETVYSSELGIVRATTVYDTETKFIVIENKATNEFHTTTQVYYTSDFINKTDLTSSIMNGLKYQYVEKEQEYVFDYKFTFIEARSLNDIYLAHASNNGVYRYDFTGVIRYKDGVSDYLYGIPYYLHLNLKTKNWADGNIRPYGLAIGTSDEAMVFTTLCGVNFSPDSKKDNIHARYSTNLGNNKFTTSGINEQTTYGVRIDPFNKNNLLLLNTDLGLIRSEDNGKSWKRAITGIKSSWVNTIYDAKFDNYKQNVVYSIWSGRHDAPYYAGNETEGKAGGFAISTDGGKTWNSNYSTGLPANSIPVKMDIVYKPNSEERIIYVAVWNEGFFVSYDSGKTFTPMNNGITRVKYDNNHSYILAADIEVTDDGRIFGITSRSTYNKAYNSGEKNEQPGEVFEYINGKWEKINVNKSHTNPRDIYYHDGTLYISSTATPTWDYKNGSDFNNYGGGVYTYKNGVVTQIFDESISTTGVQIDSKGTIFISDINGNIYRQEKGENFTTIYEKYHSISKGIELNGDDELFLAAFGGGVLRINGLTKLYTEEPPAKVYYNITFNTDGGTAISSQKIEQGKKATKPTNPTKEGYTFDSWYLGETKYDFNTPVTKDITLTAKWIKNEEPTPTYYTVTFDTNGGNSIANSKVQEGKTVSKPTNPTKEGYTFDTWYLGETKYDFNTPVTKDITLTAKWTKNEEPQPETFTVTIKTTDGQTITKIINKGEKLPRPSAPVREGYKFIEWQYNGTTYDFNQPITSDITLVAIWEEIEVNPAPVDPPAPNQPDEIENPDTTFANLKTIFNEHKRDITYLSLAAVLIVLALVIASKKFPIRNK